MKFDNHKSNLQLHKKSNSLFERFSRFKIYHFLFQNEVHFCIHLLYQMLSLSNQLKPVDQEDTIEYLPRRRDNYGKLIPLMFDENGEPRFMLGPHYPLFISAFLICGGLMFMLFYNYFTKFSLFWKFIVTISASAFLLSYLKVGFSKPGIAYPRTEATNQMRQMNRFCHICGLLKDRKTEHCGDCNICIQDFDHHCPWVGKCIGKQNLMAFYIFLGCTFLNIIIAFVATATANVMTQNKTL